MKKLVILCILSLICFIVGCENSQNDDTNDKVEDKIKPIIMINSNYRKVSIFVGEEFDIMQGVTGLDNIDGDLTKKIQYNAEDLNLEEEGVYNIYYYLTDSSSNSADVVTKEVTVIDNRIMQRPEIYVGVIENEAATPNIPPIFSGAWYHKVVSSEDYWCGIEGVLQLPEVDINRYAGDYDTSLPADPYVKNLDNPSIYMGGNAITESDVGLSFSQVQLGNGYITPGSYAFRPFWRYITTPDKADLGDCDLANGRNHGVTLISSGYYYNCYSTYHYSFTEYYYMPGDVLRIIIAVPEPNYVQLQIEVLEVSTLPLSVQIRKENNWKAPQNFKSPLFSSPGHGTDIKTHYKRVNAIDQVANEGSTEIHTTTSVTNAVWKEVFLYRKINGQLRSIPMIEQRRAMLNNPDNDYFTINKYLYNDKDYGGMQVSIHPGRKN